MYGNRGKEMKEKSLIMYEITKNNPIVREHRGTKPGTMEPVMFGNLEKEEKARTPEEYLEKGREATYLEHLNMDEEEEGNTC